MRKLLMLIGALIMSNAYGEGVIWYTDDSNISATSCTAGGNITKPTNPSKSGYRFMGWKKETGAGSGTIFGINSTSSSCPEKNSNAPCNGNCAGKDTACSWAFPYGIATGGWACVLENAADSSTFYSGARRTRDSVTPSNQDYKYLSCWCKISSLTVKGVSITVPGKWVYYDTRYRDCPGNCFNFCKSSIGTNSVFRKYAMFGE